MAVKYWPVVVPKEENALLFPVRQISRTSVTSYLQNGRRYTMGGITLYTKPTAVTEVGFLIRRRAGSAVLRNKTRRVFKGYMHNFMPTLLPNTGYLLMFHRGFFSTGALKNSLQQLLDRANETDK